MREQELTIYFNINGENLAVKNPLNQLKYSLAPCDYWNNLTQTGAFDFSEKHEMSFSTEKNPISHLLQKIPKGSNSLRAFDPEKFLEYIPSSRREIYSEIIETYNEAVVGIDSVYMEAQALMIRGGDLFPDDKTFYKRSTIEPLVNKSNDFQETASNCYDSIEKILDDFWKHLDHDRPDDNETESKLLKKNASQKKQIARLNSQLTQLNKKNNSLNSDLTDLKSQLRKKAQETKKLHQLSSSLQSTIEQGNDKIEDLQTQITNYASLLDIQDTTISEKNAQIEAIRTALNEEQTEKNDLLERLKSKESLKELLAILQTSSPIVSTERKKLSESS